MRTTPVLALLSLLAISSPSGVAVAEDADAIDAGEDDGKQRGADDLVEAAKVIKRQFSDVKAACAKIGSVGSALACYQSVDVAALRATLRSARTGWNEIAKNGRLTLGPREIEFGTDQRGALYGRSGRRFVSVEPLWKATVTVTIAKRGGRSGGSVEACLTPEAGEATCKSVTFEDGRDRGATQTITFDEALGRNLAVRVKGDGPLTRKFAYTLKVD
jgi:hypothetical protein